MRGLIPLNLMADEIRRSAGSTNAGKKIQKIQTLCEVQRRWSDSGRDVWMHRLMPDITPWSNRRKEMTLSFWLTQFLNGHGALGQYRHRIGKAEGPSCLECGHTDDTAEHAVFY